MSAKSNPFQQVVEFNRKVLGVEQRTIAPLNKGEYQITCDSLLEELNEFKEGMAEGDILKQIDSLFDGIYFGIGALYKMGLTPHQMSEIFSAIHDANMTKVRGTHEKRGDGLTADAIKPTGWVPPEQRIAEIIG